MASKLDEILAEIDTLSVEELKILLKRVNELLARRKTSSKLEKESIQAQEQGETHSKTDLI